MRRRGIRIENLGSLSRHEGNIRLERGQDRLGMAAEKHSRAHRHREPLVSIARDGIRVLDPGEMRPQAGRDDSSAPPRCINVEP